MLSRGQKVGFFMAEAVKYASSPKNELGSPRIDFKPILPTFWVPGETQHEEKSVPGGGQKKRRCLRPLLF